MLVNVLFFVKSCVVFYIIILITVTILFLKSKINYGVFIGVAIVYSLIIFCFLYLVHPMIDYINRLEYRERESVVNELHNECIYNTDIIDFFE